MYTFNEKKGGRLDSVSNGNANSLVRYYINNRSVKTTTRIPRVIQEKLKRPIQVAMINEVSDMGRDT